MDEEKMPTSTAGDGLDRVGQWAMLPDELGQGFVTPMARVDVQDDDARVRTGSHTYVSRGPPSPPFIDRGRIRGGVFQAVGDVGGVGLQ